MALGARAPIGNLPPPPPADEDTDEETTDEDERPDDTEAVLDPEASVC